MGIVARLFTLKNDLVILWRALWHAETPLYLRLAIIGLGVYVLSPIDIVPDVLLGLGVIDDFMIVTFASRWIVSKLPDEVVYPSQPQSRV